MLPGLSSDPTNALAEALALAAACATCPDCEAKAGLCNAHKWEILPQLARPAWVRLMGATIIEQADLQHLTPEDMQRAESHRLAVMRYVEALSKARRKNARRTELRHKLAA